MAWFRRKHDDESMDPQVLLAKAQTQEPAGPFRLTVADVFTITGRGTVVTGQVEAGSVEKGSTVRLQRADGSGRDVTVTGVEMFRKIVDVAQAGDNVGLLLKDVAREEIASGDVLST